MIERLNVGCGPHYAPGWLNTDVVESDEYQIYPDLLVTRDDLFPFSDATFSRVYLGHVLEHVPWPDCEDFLKEVCRVTKPGGEVAIVGPDTKRTLRLWKDGALSESMVDSILEDATAHMTSGEWEGARHQWNCYEERVLRLLDAVGIDAEPVTLPELEANGWPVVSFAPWQFGVIARV